VLDILLVEADIFYIMDRGYLDFVRLHAMLRAGAFFFTRAKENMDARRVYSFPVDRASGIICDQRVMLNGFYSAENYPDHLRRIRFAHQAIETIEPLAHVGCTRCEITTVRLFFRKSCNLLHSSMMQTLASGTI
jgi:hypothetical protein